MSPTCAGAPVARLIGPVREPGDHGVDHEGTLDLSRQALLRILADQRRQAEGIGEGEGHEAIFARAHQLLRDLRRHGGEVEDGVRQRLGSTRSTSASRSAISSERTTTPPVASRPRGAPPRRQGRRRPGPRLPHRADRCRPRVRAGRRGSRRPNPACSSFTSRWSAST